MAPPEAGIIHSSAEIPSACCPLDLTKELLSPNPAPIPIIRLKIHSASELPHADGILNNIDPYVVACYGPLTYQSTVFHKLGENPHFGGSNEKGANESGSNGGSGPLTFSFPNFHFAQLSILLFDHDYCRTKDDFLGKYVIDLPDTLGGPPGSLVEAELTGMEGEKINRWSKSKTARVLYSVWSEVGPWPAPSLKAFCHRRKVAGVLKSIETGDFKWHKTFEISLMYVGLIFGGSTQHWNTEYKKAQQIFSKDSWSSTMLRSVVSSTNSLLHQNTMLDTTMMKIEGGNEFLALLKNGRKKKNDGAKLYTYVIMESSFVFSETGKGFISDMVSKHAVHSGASTDVYYSGEFHISRTAAGEVVAVFDNNSGTYSPDPNALPKLLMVLKANFPGILFDCVDFKSSELLEYRKRAGIE